MTLLTQQRIISNGLGQVRFDDVWPAYAKARPEPALLDGLFAPKLLELRRIVESVVVEQGRKVVVFSQWRRDAAPGGVGDQRRPRGRRARGLCSSRAPSRRRQRTRTSSTCTTSPTPPSCS